RGGFNVQNLFRRGNQAYGDYLSNVGFNDAEINTMAGILGPDLLDTAGPLRITMAPFTGIGNGGRSINRNLDQHLVTFGDSVSWITGNHSIKAGADIVRNQAVDGFTATRGNPRGFLNYGTSMSAYSNFLLGLPPSSATYVGATRRGDLDVSNWEDGFFIQDDYQIRPSLTLNLGLRYELITPFVEKNDLMVNFDPNTSVNPGFQGRFVIPSDKTRALLDPRFISYGVVT